MTVIDGSLIYPEGWDPVLDVELVVTLQDVSRADARAAVVARGRLAPDLAPAQRFRIDYDRSVLDPRARLAVRAQGFLGGRLVLTSTEHIPAPPDEVGHVEVRLQQVGGPPAGPSASDDPPL